MKQRAAVSLPTQLSNVKSTCWESQLAHKAHWPEGQSATLPLCANRVCNSETLCSAVGPPPLCSCCAPSLLSWLCFLPLACLSDCPSVSLSHRPVRPSIPLHVLLSWFLFIRQPYWLPDVYLVPGLGIWGNVINGQKWIKTAHSSK